MHHLLYNNQFDDRTDYCSISCWSITWPLDFIYQKSWFIACFCYQNSASPCFILKVIWGFNQAGFKFMSRHVTQVILELPASSAVKEEVQPVELSWTSALHWQRRHRSQSGGGGVPRLCWCRRWRFTWTAAIGSCLAGTTCSRTTACRSCAWC